MSKPKQKVCIEWSPDFAYAIGLIVTDGCLSKSGRHVEFTSKDEEQVKNLLKALRIESRITMKTRAKEEKKNYFRVQIGDVTFYRFLESIGLMQNKSHKLTSIDIPDAYFADFLRGHFDGDGCFYSYWDPRWKSSFMYYLSFTSASETHLKWLADSIQKLFQVRSHLSLGKRCKQLKCSKHEARKLIEIMYFDPLCIHLSRKRLKIFTALSILPSR